MGIKSALNLNKRGKTKMNNTDLEIEQAFATFLYLAEEKKKAWNLYKKLWEEKKKENPLYSLPYFKVDR